MQLCAAPYGDNMNLLVEVLVVMIAACTPIILTVIFLFYPRNRDVYEEELYGGDYNSAAAKTIYGTNQVNTVYRTNPVTMYGTNPMTTVYGTNPVNTLYGANPANAMYRPSPAYIPESGNTAYSSNAGNTMFKGSAPAQEADNKANTPDQDVLHTVFRQGYEYFCKLKRQRNDIDYLSMGMTSDYAIAVEEGANMVRVGTALFGARDYGNRGY